MIIELGAPANIGLSFSAQQVVIHPHGPAERLIMRRVQSQVLAYRSSQTISFLSVGGCTLDFMDPMGLVKFYYPAIQQEEKSSGGKKINIMFKVFVTFITSSVLLHIN